MVSEKADIILNGCIANEKEGKFFLKNLLELEGCIEKGNMRKNSIPLQKKIKIFQARRLSFSKETEVTPSKKRSTSILRYKRLEKTRGTRLCPLQKKIWSGLLRQYTGK